MVQRILIVGISLVAAVIQRPLAFEVASIKPSTQNQFAVMVMAGIMPQPGGRLNITNANLRMLIRFAYNIDDSQISGGPSWMDSDHYDIVAKGDSDASRDDLRRMLQSLLGDRFELKVHHDSKELQVFALVAGKGAPKLKHAEEVKEDTSAPLLPLGRGAPDGTGYRGAIRMQAGGGTKSFNGIMSMEQLAQNLSNMLGRKVLNKTGLEGDYDVKLEWTSQPGETPMERGFPPSIKDPGVVTSTDPNGTGLFTAIQEQLGLKLESQKGPVDVLVIDAAAKPAEN
jgi:uncharacterized protein (TIGR03435 family)